MGHGTSTPSQEDGTVPGVCRIFNSPHSECTNDDCQELHICFFFAIGKCLYGEKCNRGHLLNTAHNKSVLRANGWSDDNQHPKILKLLEEKFKLTADGRREERTDGLSTLQVCFAYNTVGCERGSCRNLHLCLNYLMNKCALGGKCHLEHDLAKSGHNTRVLSSAKLLNTKQQVIADSLREKYIAMSNQQNKQEPKKKDCDPRQEEKSAQEPVRRELPVKQDAENYKPKSRGVPSACIAYNKGGCSDESCPFLHVCFSYIMGRCSKKERCLKEHNIFKGEQNKEVLRKFDLLDAKDVFAKIREGYETRAAARAAAIESSGGASGGATPSPPPSAAQSRATPPTSLTCSVCSEAFVRATTLGCTHTFCEDCVRRAERQGQPCPLCRAPIATAVRSLVIDDAVAEWFDGRDEETQRARRQLETERRRAAAVPQPLKAAAAVPSSNRPPGVTEQQRSGIEGRSAKAYSVSTTVTVYSDP